MNIEFMLNGRKTSAMIEADGSLTGFAHVDCGGKTPRNFVIDPAGEYVLVGNQDSDTIVVFAIQEDGTLLRQETFSFGSPVCIRFLSDASGLGV